MEIPTGLPLVYDTITRRIRLLEDGGVRKRREGEERESRVAVDETACTSFFFFTSFLPIAHHHRTLISLSHYTSTPYSLSPSLCDQYLHQLSFLCSIQFHPYLSFTVYYLCRPIPSLLSPCVLKPSHTSIYLIRSSSYVLSSYTFRSAISLTPLPPPPPFISSSQHLSLFFFSSSSSSSSLFSRLFSYILSILS